MPVPVKYAVLPLGNGAVVVFNDITRRQQAEDQLRQVQKMEAVGQLAGGVAHDFNNLLTIINGYGELLRSRLPPGDPNREMLDTIVKAGERAATLTRQLLTFSRKQVVAPRVLDLNGVVSDMEKMLRRVIAEDIALTTSLQPDLGQIKADPGQLEQVLMNLAVNARDAMPQGGKLLIETTNMDRPGPYVMLAVSDSGHGMTPEVKARIFEPFFTTKETGNGTGLGLATVHGIVQQCGGYIEVESQPGAGTTFRIFLPRTEEAGHSHKSVHDLKVAPRGTETVLLVEDEDAVRSLGQHILHDCGYTVLEAADGKEALQVGMQHQGSIHLLVTDVVMPGVGGRLVAEQLVGLRPEMKVLYTSGYADDAVVHHGVLQDRMNFLQKPFVPVALAQKVREVLDGPSPN